MTRLQVRSAVFAGVLVGALTACTTDQLVRLNTGAARVEPGLTAACNDLVKLSTLAGLVPGVGAIVPYISVACGTAEGFTRLAADPSSTEWLGRLRGKIETLANAAGVKFPE